MFKQHITRQARIIVFVTFIAFLSAQLSVPFQAKAENLSFDDSELMVPKEKPFKPLTIQGINIDYDNAFKLNFLINKGNTEYDEETFKKEAEKLIKYFLASLTIPEDEMWVNLSIYEEDRIIPENFGKTIMGRDLLAQDYTLKKVMSSLMYPDSDLGKTFWSNVYARAKEEFGITDIPLNTFNKVWIIASDAKIYEHTQGAFVLDSHMKVMLEEDYLALEMARQTNLNNDYRPYADASEPQKEEISKVASELLRKILIPELEKEVNQGALFSNLRQIYHSMILASWYKQALKETLLGHLYIDKGKVEGVNSADPEAIQKTYAEYVKSVKKGVYTFIQEEYDAASKEIIARKYFSGGVLMKAPQVSSMSREATESLNPEDFALITVQLRNTGFLENPDLAASTTGAIQKRWLDSLDYLDSLQTEESDFQGLYYNGILIAQKSQFIDTAMTTTLKDVKKPGAGLLGSEVFANFMNMHFPETDLDETILDIISDQQGNVFVTGPQIESGIVKMPAVVKEEIEASPQNPVLTRLIYWPPLKEEEETEDEEEGSLFYNGTLIASPSEFIEQPQEDGAAVMVPSAGNYQEILTRFLETHQINPDNIAAQLEDKTNNWYISGPEITGDKKRLPPKPKATLNAEDLGGIDLHPDNLNVRIEKDGEGIIIPVTPQIIENMPIQGLTPIIIEISPIKNLSVLIR